MRTLFLLVSAAAAVSFSNTGESQLVHFKTAKLVAPFALTPQKGLFVATLRCKNVVGMNLFYATTKANACDSEMVGTVAQINEWAAQVSAESLTPDATLDLQFTVKSYKGKHSIVASQRIFAPRNLRLTDVRSDLRLDRADFKVQVAVWDPAYVTPESTFSVRPHSDWPENLSAFTDGSSLSLFLTKEFRVTPPKSVSFVIVDHKTNLVSEPITLQLTIAPALVNQNLLLPLLVSLGVTFTFFIGLFVFFVIPEDIRGNAKKPETPAVAPAKKSENVELNSTISDWNRRVVERVSAEKHNMSMTRDTLNESEIKDVVFTRVSALDVSRNAAELDLNNSI